MAFMSIASRFHLRKKRCEPLNKVLVILLVQEYLAMFYPRIMIRIPAVKRKTETHTLGVFSDFI